MSERRRTNRFVVPSATQGVFRQLSDVCVEAVEGDLVTLLSDHSLQPLEQLLLELPRALGLRSVVQVEVLGCATVWNGDSRRFRIVVRREGAKELPALVAPKSRFVAPLAALPALGVLIRRIPVEISDVSTAGCQLQSTEPLIEGSVGQLEVAMDGELHQEPIRVCRTAHAPGSARSHRAGATFLALSAPPPASVRNVVARFEIIDELAHRFR